MVLWGRWRDSTTRGSSLIALLPGCLRQTMLLLLLCHISRLIILCDCQASQMTMIANMAAATGTQSYTESVVLDFKQACFGELILKFLFPNIINILKHWMSFQVFIKALHFFIFYFFCRFYFFHFIGVIKFHHPVSMGKHIYCIFYLFNRIMIQYTATESINLKSFILNT